MKMKHALATVALLMGMTSCTTPATDKTLDINGEWKVTTIQGEPVPETLEETILSFDDSTHSYHGVTGVNTINGSYQLENKALTLDEGAMTRRMGDSISNEVEVKYINAIHATESIAENDGKLELLDGNGNVLMILEKK